VKLGSVKRIEILKIGKKINEKNIAFTGTEKLFYTIEI
jgi:hypothetical protein